MPRDSGRAKARQARLAAGREARTTQPTRPEVRGGGGAGVAMVIRSLNIEGGEMWAQRIDYADDPPVVGSYETCGDLVRVYPLWCLTYDEYLVWVWPETVENDEGLVSDNPLSIQTVVMIARPNRNGQWIVEPSNKIDGSLMDPSELPDAGFG